MANAVNTWQPNARLLLALFLWLFVVEFLFFMIGCRFFTGDWPDRAAISSHALTFGIFAAVLGLCYVIWYFADRVARAAADPNHRRKQRALLLMILILSGLVAVGMWGFTVLSAVDLVKAVGNASEEAVYNYLAKVLFGSITVVFATYSFLFLRRNCKPGSMKTDTARKIDAS